MKHTLTLFFCLLFIGGFSQKITRMVWLDGEEIKNLTKRKLVICTYTESDAEVVRLKAKLAKAKDEKKKSIEEKIAYHENLNKIFKDNLTNLVKQNWTISSTENIEVLSFTDLKAQAKKKKTDKAVIMLRYYQLSGSAYDPTSSSVDLPAITLQGVEHIGSNSNSISFPLIQSNEKDPSLNDAALTIKLLEGLVKANLKSEKRVDIDDYVKDSISKNCNKKKESSTYVNKDLLKKIEPSEVQAAYGHKVELVSTEEFNKAYEGSEPILAAVCIPSTIAQGAIGPISTTALLYGRMVINSKTAEIYGYSDILTGEAPAEVMYKKGHFENMGKCK